MMGDMTRIGITGATGRLGGQVARILTDEGRELRLLVRSPERAPSLGDRVEVVRCAYENTPASRAALEGVQTLLLVSAGESSDRVEQHAAIIDAAGAAGVEHIVYTSFVGAAADAEFTLARDHGATEELLKRSGVATTMLRDSFYIDVLPDFAVDGVISGPAGSGRVAAVAIADVARVAAKVLADPAAHRGTVYELTGPTAVTLAEAAEAITRATGSPTRFHDETIEEAYAARASYGAPDWEVDAWVSTYTAIRDGLLERVTHDVERVTGRAPLDIEAALTR